MGSSRLHGFQHARLLRPSEFVDALSPRVAPSRSRALINDSTIVVARVLIATAFFYSAGNGKENRERRP